MRGSWFLRSREGRLVVFLCLALGLLGLFLAWSARQDSSEKVAGQAGSREEPVPAWDPGIFSNPAAQSAGENFAWQEASERAFEELEMLDTFLSTAPPPEMLREQLAEIRERIHDLPPDAAAAGIARFLASGRDRSTGLRFEVGEEGILDGSPSLRATALDLLGQTDLRLSEEVSLHILQTTASQDEFALALRNLAWANFEGRNDELLRQFFVAMLDREEWLANPSDGFLEAFDIAVETSDFGQIASVLRPLDEDGNPVASRIDRAAFIAADRIMLRNPDAVLAHFAGNPNFLDWAPMHRASLLSRLDSRNPRHREQLSAYLTQTPHAPGELEFFAEIFPNGNFFVGSRLVTGMEDTPSISAVAGGDHATLRVVQAMLADPEMRASHPALARIERRLREFLE